jgi:hypothetical protein
VLNDAIDISENISAYAAYLRDSIQKGDDEAAIHAECQLKRFDIDLWLLGVEA